jgi:Fe(3+) dicitrate transport protein
VDVISSQIYRFRTNISDSRNLGLESFMELDVNRLFYGKSSEKGISMFINYTLIDARYINSSEKAVKSGNKVEYVADNILRTGITGSCRHLKATFQYSYTSAQYTDATNAEFTATAVDGLIPAYGVMDLSVSYNYKRYVLSTSVNNLADNMYFTRRADGYPGPGIIPSDGRSFFVTLQVKI